MHPSIITGTLAIAATIAYHYARTNTKTLKSQNKNNPTPQNKQNLKRHTILRELIALVASLLIFATFTQLPQSDQPPTPIQIVP